MTNPAARAMPPDASAPGSAGHGAARGDAQLTERLLRRLLDAAGDAVFVHDVSGRILDVNDTACAALGYTRAELLAMHIADIEVQHDTTELARRWRELLGRGALTIEGVHRRRDGSTFPVEARVSLLQEDPPQVLSLARDVSARLQLEVQLRQAQRMQAIARLAGGVAHDFNTLLTAIRGNADLLLGERSPDVPEYEPLLEILKASERAAALTRQLLAFTRQQVFRPELVDPNGVVRELVPMLDRLLGSSIELATELDATGLVRVDRVQIEHALLNIVLNAREAMPHGGRLFIATKDARIDEADQARVPWLRRGAFTALIVQDDGTGMDEETQARVFEPFFTTRAKGPATGLGLSTAYGIVKQSNGFILLESEPGAGTTVQVLLPRVDGGATVPGGGSTEPASAAEAPAPATRAAGTILVAEDEDAVRLLIRRVLERQGYTILLARDGEEALRLAHESATPPDVLLSDIVMPRLGGPELARRLRRDLPALRVILMSGYTDDAYVLHGAIDEHVVFLGKPFVPDELTRAVREALGT